MSFEDLLRLTDPCPLCLDISYVDADGVEHEIFDLCAIHRRSAQLKEPCAVEVDADRPFGKAA